MESKSVKLDTKVLDGLKAIFGNLPSIKVGVLGAKANRADKENNAYIGLIHEFGRIKGTPKIPKRSFLRMPLNEKLPEKLKQNESYLKSIFEEGLKKGSLLKVWKTIGQIGVDVVKMAFITKGYGKWKGNAQSVIDKKGVDSPLVETTQLQNSITYKVK
jgi:hypothetical protein